MNNPIQNLSRRGFLQGAAGLTLGLSLPAFAAKAGAAATQSAGHAQNAPTIPSCTPAADGLTLGATHGRRTTRLVCARNRASTMAATA